MYSEISDLLMKICEISDCEETHAEIRRTCNSPPPKNPGIEPIAFLPRDNTTPPRRQSNLFNQFEASHWCVTALWLAAFRCSAHEAFANAACEWSGNGVVPPRKAFRAVLMWKCNLILMKLPLIASNHFISSLCLPFLEVSSSCSCSMALQNSLEQTLLALPPLYA